MRSGAADTAGADRGRARRAPGHRRHRGRRRAGRHGRARNGRPDRDRRAPPGWRGCRRAGRATTPLDAAGRPGPRGRDATGPVPDRLPRPRAGPGPATRSVPQAATSGPARPSSRRDRDRRGGRDTHRRAPASTRRPGPSSAADRGPRHRRRGPGAGPAARPGRHPRRQRPGPACARHRRRRRGRSTSGSPPTTSTTSSTRLRRGPRRRRRRPDRVGRRLGRSVRRRQDRHRDDRPDRSLAGRRPARQAVRVRRRRPSGRRAPVLLFGLPGNPVSSAVTFELFVRPAIRALAGRHDLLRPVDRARPRRTGVQEPRPARVHARAGRP